MKKYIVSLPILLGIGLILIQSDVFTRSAATAGLAPKYSVGNLARLGSQTIAQTTAYQSAKNPRSGRELLTSYQGSSAAALILDQNLAQPTVLAQGDFDEDGTPDLIAGYAGLSGGILAIHRGNVDAVFPNSPEAKQRKVEGSFTEAPFLSSALALEIPESPDFVAAGDFDADGHWDLAFTAISSNTLYLLSGHGDGSFALPKSIQLPGRVTVLTSGEMNRADGLTDIAVAVTAGEDAQLLIFEGPQGALKSNPESFRIPAPTTTLALGRLNRDYWFDLALAIGSELLVLEGRDRKLSLGPVQQSKVPNAKIKKQNFAFSISAMSLGDFDEALGEELALLTDDGTLHVLNGFDEVGGEIIERRSSKKLPAVARPGSSHLLTARLSGGGSDDLVISDPASSQIHIVTNEIGQQSLGTEVLSATGEPKAVLPMRLNSDALSDLVVLTSGHAAPTIVNSPQGPQSTFTVTNTNDTGAGSLRNAIGLANQNAGPDVIDFNIGPGGAQTITILSALPTITGPVTIDGTTQPGFAGTPIIELNGSSVPSGTNGFLLTGGSSTVRGLVINRMAGSGDAIEFQTNGGNIVEGNYIGTDLTGNTALPNGNAVFINGPPNNRIGGTVAAARNLLSGNSRAGIAMSGLSSTENVVQGNFIGTNAAGTADLGNTTNGVFQSQASSTIGGTVAGARNIISGNSNPGIVFNGSSGNLVQGNFIGTDVTGTIGFGVSQGGVQVISGADNSFGGSTPEARNIISGNGGHGFQIRQLGADGNMVQGNLIGTQIDGSSALGNNGDGIAVESSSNDNVVLDNVIAFNNDDGVAIVSGTGNAIIFNSMFQNTESAIDLLGNGVTPNDAGDVDTGPNDLQNFPVLTSVISGTITNIQGTLNSTANSTFIIQFYSNPNCAGIGQGKTFIGSTIVDTDSSGNVSFSAPVAASLTASEFVTATATDPNNNTSEISACRQVVQSGLSISGRITNGAGQSLSGVTVTVSGGGGSTTTDANGNYSLGNLAAGGSYTVTPSSNTHSFNPASQTFNNLNVNRIANFVGTQTVVSISGKVTDAGNNGIVNITVALTKNGVPSGTMQTDNSGNYSFGSLSAGDTYVVTPAGSFSPSSLSFRNLAVNAVANFTATPSVPPQCNTASFAAATNVVTGSLPRSVAIGDFNSDGKSDLAVANSTSNNVSILLGSGTGSFSAATNFAVALGPSSVAIGDFNGDGESDLAVANASSNNVSILLGSGTGSFGAATNFATGSAPFSVAIGDFNGDGKSDLATANNFANNVSILLGSGTGSFSAATNFALGFNPYQVVIGDFNADGNSDLAVAIGNSNSVSILLGSGTGSFGAATNFSVGTSPFSVAIGDFNGDGKSDLATGNSNSNNVSILLGSGTGSFSVATNFAVGSNPRSVAIGDFNGDGKSDLATANQSSNNVSILLGSGTGGFGGATNFAVGSTPFAVATGDFNGDGKSDLATANSNSDNVSILLNNGATCNTQTSLTISGRIAAANNSPLADVPVTLSGVITRVTQTNASGNFGFSNLVPGGSYAVTVQSSQYVFEPSRADFLNLSSSQTANFVAAPLAVPSPSPPPSDDFNSSTRDPNKWNLGTMTLPPTAFDPLVNVAQVNGQLVITPVSQATGLHYNGYVSANSFDLRGGSVSVELVEAASGGADSIFAIGSDSDNFYRFMVRTAGPGVTPVPTTREINGIERPVDVTVPQLVFQVNVGGQLTSLSIPYDPLAHRFMRFRHDAPANAIAFETSPNNIDFVERHRVTLTRSVSALTAELSAGTSSPTNPGVTRFDNFGLVTSTFQFSAANYTVDEGGGSILITVTRAGSTAGTATVDFSTSDGTALQSSDYILATGRLTFAPGETSKTFQVLIIDNAQAEGNQNLNLLLQEPSASGLNTPGRAVLTINDNDTAVPTANPLETPTFFVTEHYFDFLNRLPDQSGLDFWVNQITGCGTDTQCIEIKRINVSAAYFLSIEYQETGFLVHRFYNLALNRANGLPRYLEFFRDSRIVGNGVVIGAPGADELLEANKVAYSNEFVARAEFVALYPLTLTAAQYVDALYSHAGLTPTPAERQAAIDEFNTPAGARGRVLRRVADNSALRAREFNRAFVLAQYFGYLRRNPDDAPDNNLDGYNFWLGKLNQFNGNFVNAEMVKAFITSGEYRRRFGP